MSERPEREARRRESARHRPTVRPRIPPSGDVPASRSVARACSSYQKTRASEARVFCASPRAAPPGSPPSFQPRLTKAPLLPPLFKGEVGGGFGGEREG